MSNVNKFFESMNSNKSKLEKIFDYFINQEDFSIRDISGESSIEAAVEKYASLNLDEALEEIADNIDKTMKENPDLLEMYGAWDDEADDYKDFTADDLYEMDYEGGMFGLDD